MSTGNPQRTVLLVVHSGREEATDTARRVEKVLADHGIALRVLTSEAVDKGALHPDEIHLADPDTRAAEDCELVLVLGGDGTFLRAAELARNVEIPVLGVNLGRIGFLAESEAEAIDHVLENVRVTTRFRSSSIRSSAVQGANCAYASSTTTSPGASASASRTIASDSTMPVGLFGEHTNVIAGSDAAQTRATSSRSSDRSPLRCPTTTSEPAILATCECIA